VDTEVMLYTPVMTARAVGYNSLGIIYLCTKTPGLAGFTESHSPPERTPPEPVPY
jgi:hypothetical protein